MRLGVNIDHVATLRQARKEGFPSVIEAAQEVIKGGANSITVHLREDRRHIQDKDVKDLLKTISVPLNLEMSLSKEIVDFALKVKPARVCLVPEKRQELTTEGGLDLIRSQTKLKQVIKKLHSKNIKISLFIDPVSRQIKEAAKLGVYAIEIHTGSYANSKGAKQKKELGRIKEAARLAYSLGLEVHAGHGLNYDNVQPVLKIPEITEHNTGFAIIARAVFVGLRQAVKEMKKIISGR